MNSSVVLMCFTILNFENIFHLLHKILLLRLLKNNSLKSTQSKKKINIEDHFT